MRTQVREVRGLTDKPIGINLHPDSPSLDPWLKVAVEEGIPVAYTSIGSPSGLTERLHEAGMKVIHIGTTVRHAIKAQESAVDALCDSGG